MDLRLNGKTALVLGASKGIGAAAATELAALGANVVLVARNEAALKAQCEELSKGHHRYLICDVTDRTALAEKIDGLLKDAGGVDIFVNNTGGPAGGAIVEATDEQFLKTFEQHILVASTVTKKILPGMKQRGFGRIINIISTSVKVPIHNLGVSNTIRAAMASWAKTLANEVASHGITVNCVLPGMTSTERLEGIIKTQIEKSGDTRANVEDAYLKTIPAARFGKPEEIAAAVAFLSSPAASYVNGVALAVDGGRTGCL